MTPTLHTERLVLEPYVPADEDRFVALFADERVNRWMGTADGAPTESRELFGRVFTHVYPTNRFDVWAVRGDGGYLGHAELKHTDTVDGHELIYALRSAYWGRGLGTELARALVEYGFDSLGLDAVHATVDAPNGASLRLLDRLGFVHVRDVEELGEPTVRVLTVTRVGYSRANPSG